MNPPRPVRDRFLELQETYFFTDDEFESDYEDDFFEYQFVDASGLSSFLDHLGDLEIDQLVARLSDHSELLGLGSDFQY